MNQILSGYADECEKAEYQFVELWFRATYGADRWKPEIDAAEVVIRYPDTFDVTPFAEVLEQAQAALTLEMPHEFMVELRRRLVGNSCPMPRRSHQEDRQGLERDGEDETPAGARRAEEDARAARRRTARSGRRMSDVKLLLTEAEKLAAVADAIGRSYATELGRVLRDLERELRRLAIDAKAGSQTALSRAVRAAKLRANSRRRSERLDTTSSPRRRPRTRSIASWSRWASSAARPSSPRSRRRTRRGSSR
jgi:hypothetical protein